MGLGGRIFYEKTGQGNIVYQPKINIEANTTEIVLNQGNYIYELVTEGRRSLYIDVQKEWASILPFFLPLQVTEY